MLISPREILPSHSLIQSNLLALLLLYHVQTPHLQSSVEVCSWQSHFSFILFIFFHLPSHLEFPHLFLVQQVNILIFTSQQGKLVYVHFQSVKTYRTIQSITLKFLMLLINPLELLTFVLKYQLPKAGTEPPAFQCINQMFQSSALSRLTFFKVSKLRLVKWFVKWCFKLQICERILYVVSNIDLLFQHWWLMLNAEMKEKIGILISHVRSGRQHRCLLLAITPI